MMLPPDVDPRTGQIRVQEKYKQLPFTVKANPVTLGLMLTGCILGFIAWLVALAKLMMIIQSGTVLVLMGFAALVLFGVFKFYAHALICYDKILVVNEEGIKYFAHKLIKWRYIMTVSEDMSGISIGMNPIVDMAKSSYGALGDKMMNMQNKSMGFSAFSLIQVFYALRGESPASGPHFKTNIMDAKSWELVMALKYHLKFRQESQEERFPPPMPQ